MPDKVVTPIYHDMSKTEVREYEGLWDEYLLERKRKKKNGEVERELVELILLRQFIAKITIAKTIAMVENALEQDQKVVIFTNFTEELTQLHEHFGKQSVIHYGEMSDKKKQVSVDRFQTDSKARVFIGNIKSAGVGINLTEGTIVIFNSFDWVPGNNEQAEDRCIFGGQNILTDGGYKLIEDIEVGDKVYTHKGNFKSVIDKHSHLERSKLRYDINAFGYNRDLSVTHDHKLYVYDKLKCEFKWLEAKDIDMLKHGLTIKSKEQSKIPKKFLTVKNFIDIKFKNNHDSIQTNGRLVGLPNKIELTNDLLYAFGFFIADGWTVLSDSKSATVNICQKITNSKMYDAAEYIINIIKSSFGIEKHSDYIDKNNVKTCTIHSKNLTLNFKNWFGSDVYSKQLPEWVDELNNEQLTSLLDGYYHGDGYQRGKTQQATTASLKLVSQLIRYNANLGRTVSLTNKGINNYSIEYSFGDIANKKIKYIDGYIVYPIKNITISRPKRGEERVYDLSVEGDHSFIVGNYNVHNCYRIGQMSNVNVYYQLFRNSISIKMWDMLANKKTIINQIIGDKEINDVDEVELIIDYIVEDI